MSNHSFNTQNQFINENHENLLETFENLESSLEGDFDKSHFQRKTGEFFTMLENHFLHEETILKGAGFNAVEDHILLHRKLAVDLRGLAAGIERFEQIADFLKYSRSEVLKHELMEDQKYWPVLDPAPSNNQLLIHWSSDLETGHSEVDKHHSALIQHINRFHILFNDTTFRKLACSELRSIYAYNEVHFQEEEKYFEEANVMNPEHSAAHESLLLALKLLIEEFEKGKASHQAVSAHLKSWFLAHLRHFDVPAFKRALN